MFYPCTETMSRLLVLQGLVGYKPYIPDDTICPKNTMIKDTKDSFDTNIDDDVKDLVHGYVRLMTNQYNSLNIINIPLPIISLMISYLYCIMDGFVLKSRSIDIINCRFIQLRFAGNIQVAYGQHKMQNTKYSYTLHIKQFVGKTLTVGFASWTNPEGPYYYKKKGEIYYGIKIDSVNKKVSFEHCDGIRHRTKTMDVFTKSVGSGDIIKVIFDDVYNQFCVKLFKWNEQQYLNIIKEIKYLTMIHTLNKYKFRLMIGLQGNKDGVEILDCMKIK